MNVALWAEIRRLAEIESLSARAISSRMRTAESSGHCSTKALILA